jgi:hypothetical protein
MDEIDRMLTRFAGLYGEPKTDDPTAFAAEYRQVLKGFTDTILADTADRVIRDQVYRAWPTPGECYRAANAIAAVRRPRPQPDPVDPGPHYTVAYRGTPEFDAAIADLERRCGSDDPAEAKVAAMVIAGATHFGRLKVWPKATGRITGEASS